MKCLYGEGWMGLSLAVFFSVENIYKASEHQKSIYIGIGKHCTLPVHNFIRAFMARKISNQYNDNIFYSNVKCSQTKIN